VDIEWEYLDSREAMCFPPGAQFAVVTERGGKVGWSVVFRDSTIILRGPATSLEEGQRLALEAYERGKAEAEAEAAKGPPQYRPLDGVLLEFLARQMAASSRYGETVAEREAAFERELERGRAAFRDEAERLQKGEVPGGEAARS
jgi:hypothetical protein